MAHSLFVWFLDLCCRKLPLTDQLRVGSGAGLPAQLSDADIKSDSIFAAPALHPANADRRTEPLASKGESSTSRLLRPTQLANIQPYKTEDGIGLDSSIGILIRCPSSRHVPFGEDLSKIGDRRR